MGELAAWTAGSSMGKKSLEIFPSFNVYLGFYETELFIVNDGVDEII